MDPRKVPAQKQFQYQISIPSVVLLPPPGKLPNVGSVAYPNLTPQFFQQFLEPGRITTAFKAHDHWLAGKLLIKGSYLTWLIVHQHQVLDLSSFGCQITDRLLTSMKVHPDIYCHGRLLLLTQIMFTPVSLTTNGWRRPLHNIRRPCPHLCVISLTADEDVRVPSKTY